MGSTLGPADPADQVLREIWRHWENISPTPLTSASPTHVNDASGQRACSPNQFLYSDSVKFVPDPAMSPHGHHGLHKPSRTSYVVGAAQAVGSTETTRRSPATVYHAPSPPPPLDVQLTDIGADATVFRTRPASASAEAVPSPPPIRGKRTHDMASDNGDTDVAPGKRARNTAGMSVCNVRKDNDSAELASTASRLTETHAMLATQLREAFQARALPIARYFADAMEVSNSREASAQPKTLENYLAEHAESTKTKIMDCLVEITGLPITESGTLNPCRDRIEAAVNQSLIADHEDTLNMAMRAVSESLALSDDLAANLDASAKRIRNALARNHSRHSVRFRDTAARKCDKKLVAELTAKLEILRYGIAFAARGSN